MYIYKNSQVYFLIIYSKKVCMIAIRLSYVPVKNPTIPTSMMKQSLAINNFEGDFLSTNSKTSSIKGGNINAKADEQKAPIKEISIAIFGTASATATKEFERIGKNFISLITFFYRIENILQEMCNTYM